MCIHVTSTPQVTLHTWWEVCPTLHCTATNTQWKALASELDVSASFTIIDAFPDPIKNQPTWCKQQSLMSHVTPEASATATLASWLPFRVSLRNAVTTGTISGSTETTVLFAIVSGTKAAESDKHTPEYKCQLSRDQNNPQFILNSTRYYNTSAIKLKTFWDNNYCSFTCPALSVSFKSGSR